MGTGGKKHWTREVNAIVVELNRGLVHANRVALGGEIPVLAGIGDGEYILKALGKTWNVKFSPRDD